MFSKEIRSKNYFLRSFSSEKSPIVGQETQSSGWKENDQEGWEETRKMARRRTCHAHPAP
jgi:hypothetical protein